MKYLKQFNNESEYNSFKNSVEYVEPNISFVKNTPVVKFNRRDPILTFTAVQANSTIKLRRIGTNTALTNAILQYSINGGKTWNEYILDTDIILPNIGDSVKFKGTNTTLGVDQLNYHRFTMTGKISAKGDVTSLLNDIGGDCTLQSYTFRSLFYNCPSLTTAPALPSTILAERCYYGMFGQCTSLTVAPELPAMTLAPGCYAAMFQECTSLIAAPKLSAMTLSANCYQNMFKYCTSLTTAPELPATNLTQQCYYEMFSGCTSLTIAPVLPATKLIQSCYVRMFEACSNLSYIKAMFTSTPSTNFTQYWLSNVAANGTFVKNSVAQWDVTGSSGIPSGWTVQTATA